MEDADHVVDLRAAHHDLLVAAGPHRLDHRLLAVVEIDPVDLVARGHDLADTPFADGEDAGHRVLLGLVQQAGLVARGDEEAEFGGRGQVPLALAGAQAEQPQHAVAEPVEEMDRRPEHQQEQGQRAHDHERGALAALEREALRSEFAEHDVQGGDDEEGHRHRDRMGGDAGRRLRQPEESGLDQVGERRLADPSEGQR